MDRSQFILVTGMLVLVSFALPTVAAVASPATAPKRHLTFYLDLKPGECVRYTANPKQLLLVSCSDPLHNMEVYGRFHGGWTDSRRPSLTTLITLGRTRCLALFKLRFAANLRIPFGYQSYIADPGRETVKYHDRVICGLVRYPRQSAMGPGTHFHQATI